MNKIPVLKIKDEKGNLIPINAIRGENGKDGTNGKSAYEQAKEGGYKGTEEEFIAMLNGLTSSTEASHYINYGNPHKVTAEQIGAIKEVYYTSADLNTELINGSGKMIVCCYNESTQRTPYTEGKTTCSHGMVITNAFTSGYATQMCMPSGEDTIYVRKLNGNGIFQWSKMATDEQLNAHSKDHNITTGDGFGGGVDSWAHHGGAIGKGARANGGGAVGSGAVTQQGFAGGNWAKTVTNGGVGIDAIQLGIGTNPNEKTLQVYDYQLMGANGLIPSERLPFASGSYKGTNTCGINNPNTLTFDFVPKFVIVSQRGERNATGGGCFIWISSGTTLNFINNGSNYWVHPTLTDKTLSWYCAESASYQLNSSNYTYDYFAWG